LSQQFSDEQTSLFQIVQDCAEKEGLEVYVVGGLVRDLLLGLSLGGSDLDFMLAGESSSFSKSVLAKVGGSLQEFKPFLTAKLTSPTLF